MPLIIGTHIGQQTQYENLAIYILVQFQVGNEIELILRISDLFLQQLSNVILAF